jgi:hypothetical protein
MLVQVRSASGTTVFAATRSSEYSYDVSARAPIRYGPLLPGEGASVAEDMLLEHDEGSLDEVERRALAASITVSLQQAASGLVAPADRVLEQLRARRR